MLVRKCVKQRNRSSEELLELMRRFRAMTNDCVRLGLNNNVTSMKKLSLLAYRETARWRTVKYYRLCAISKAAGILSSRRKSLRRGYLTRDSYVKRFELTSCYGFKIINGKLRVPLGKKRFELITLNQHTLTVLSESGIKVRSFTITPNSLSLSLAKELEPYRPKSFVGLDRNLRNVTVGNENVTKVYRLDNVVEIGQTTRSIIRSLKRNDLRVCRQLSGKYGRRRRERINQILHNASKQIVDEAHQNRQAIVFENIDRIRNLYRKGNGQGRNTRAVMNSWPYFELKRQVEYKAGWRGVPVIQLSRAETMGTTRDCGICGERLRIRRDRVVECARCGFRTDRDHNAVINIARRGRLRFDRSTTGLRPEGRVNEAMVQEPTKVSGECGTLDSRYPEVSSKVHKHGPTS